MKKEPFVILVYIALKPDFEDEYLSLINGVVDQMRHEASFVNAVVHRSADDQLCLCSMRRGSIEKNSSQYR